MPTFRGGFANSHSAGSVFDVAVKGKDARPFFHSMFPAGTTCRTPWRRSPWGWNWILPPEQIRQGLERFRGADRRFQIKAEVDGITIVDDYGHHPTEIRATLDAARLRGAKRIIAIFQPHRYTRTKFLLDELAGSFAGCDRVYVLDIYAASEPPIPGVSSERLVGRMHELGVDSARYAPSERRGAGGTRERRAAGRPDHHHWRRKRVEDRRGAGERVGSQELEARSSK